MFTKGSLDRHRWWSPDGNLLYFISERDGYRCMWAIRLDPVTRRPLGEPFSVRHFHQGRRVLTKGLFGMGMTKDRLYFSQYETVGNIWLAEPLEQP